MRTVIRLSEDADTNADSPRDTSGDDRNDV
jgi:hypothetical protein